MKKVLFFILAIIASWGLSSCGTGTFSSVSGKEDVAYIFITSSSDLANKTVKVQVDENAPFEVKVQKAKQKVDKYSGKLHAILPGKRHVTVTYDGKVLYSKDVFLSSQQTKTINL